MLTLCAFDEAVKGASLVVTGEGRVDIQSANGKVLDGVLSRTNGVPVVAIAGSVGAGIEALQDKGLTAVYSLMDADMPLSYAMENAEMLYKKRAEEMFRSFVEKLEK